MIQVKSSLIKAIGYDEKTQTLTVEFKKGGKYTYSKVTEQIFNNFRSAPSIGKFFLGETIHQR